MRHEERYREKHVEKMEKMKHHHKRSTHEERREEMNDNRKVKDNHQEGISRVIQRKGDMEIGQHGKMHNSPEERARWLRSNKLTPRQA